MRCIIAGGRDFRDYQFLSEVCNDYEDQITQVICGETRGADSLGKLWAEARGIHVRSFPANWDKYGVSAGPIRNREMANNADMLIAFWNGKSKGTKHMIDIAKKKRLIVYVQLY